MPGVSRRFFAAARPFRYSSDSLLALTASCGVGGEVGGAGAQAWARRGWAGAQAQARPKSGPGAQSVLKLPPLPAPHLLCHEALALGDQHVERRGDGLKLWQVGLLHEAAVEVGKVRGLVVEALA
jgi:hypothetical protein